MDYYHVDVQTVNEQTLRAALESHMDEHCTDIEIAHAGEHLGLCSLQPPYPTREAVLAHFDSLDVAARRKGLADLFECPW